MDWMRSKRRGPIGLDLGSRWIKAVQLSGAPGAWRIAAASMLPRPQSGEPITSEEISRAAEVLARQGFTGEEVVVTVPNEKLICGILDMPPKDSGAPVDQIARAELASIHRIEPGNFEMAWWELPLGGRGRESTRVMAAACPHAAAEEWIGLLAGGGFEVVALDTEAACISRLCGTMSHSQSDVLPVLDLGWRAARLVLMHQGTIVYERRLSEAGLAPLGQAIASELRVEPAIAEYLLTDVGLGRPAGETVENAGEDLPQLDEAHRVIRDHFGPLCLEVQSSMAYLEHQYGETSRLGAALVGGGAMIPGLAEHLGTAMNCQARRVTPAQHGTCTSGLLGLAGSALLSAAMGLAMHEVGWNGKVLGRMKISA